MTTYNTGNAVPSADARDRYDNSQVFDELMNGPAPVTPDRLGVLRQSWAGMEQDFNGAQIDRAGAFEGAQAARAAEFQVFLDASGWSSLGNYASGISIISHSQVVDYQGQPYALKSTVPASVETPYVTTGNWATESVNFKLVGDSTLRQDLQTGALKVGCSVVTVSDVRGIPAIPTATGISIALRQYIPTAPGDADPKNYKGGGLLYYIASIPKTAHNGGTVFSPTCIWDGLSTTHAAYLSGAGDTDQGGLGCWCRLEQGYLNLEWFGGSGDGVKDNAPVMLKAFSIGRHIYAPIGTWLSSPVTVPSTMAGLGVTGEGFYHYSAMKGTTFKPTGLQAHIFQIGNGSDNFTFSDLRIDGNAQADICVDAPYGAFLGMDRVGVYGSKLYGLRHRQGLGRFSKVWSGSHEKIGFEVYSDSSITDSEFSGGTEPLRLVAGGNRLVNVWANSGSESCLTIEPLNSSTTLINTSITNLYAGEVFGGGLVVKPIIKIKGLASQKVQQVQITNSHLVSAAGEANKINTALDIEHAKEVTIDNLAVLGGSPQTTTKMLQHVLTARYCESLNINGGVFRAIGKNAIILGAECYGVKIDGVIFAGWAASVAAGTEGAAILITDVNNYGSVENCSFDDASGSTVPYPMQGGADTRFTFADNFVRVNNANYWIPAVGKPRFSSISTLGSARDMASSVSTGGSAWNQVSAGAPLALGTYQLWVDAAGRLRIKAGAPTSDTDGAIVGTQA